MEENKKMSLEEQEKRIIEIAEAKGVQTNYFFITTFDRYLTQLKILKSLKEALNKDGMLVSKEYVKGRKNLYTNPAVAEYNKTTDSANKTVSTLMKIIKGFSVNSDGDDGDPLFDAINGSEGDE